ncbi:MAG: esterase-like activity of phytase family protein, partial [Allosphingosinicella sp.]
MTGTDQAPRFRLKQLAWSDESLGTIEFPARPMQLRMSYGSGLARRAGDSPGIVWGVGDRGPNLKVKAMIEHYGLEHLRPHADRDGAKVMLRPDVGPRIAQLRLGEDRVELLASFSLCGNTGRPISGLPIPGGDHARMEPALDVDGNELPPDASGADTEGIAPTGDGGFWISEEFGPSLLRVDEEGHIFARFVPEGVEVPDTPFPVHAVLPAIAAKRRLNCGFEAIALSPDGRWLYLAFQSPLAHPDDKAHKQARHVRLWRLDAETLQVAAQYAYPLDPPESFLRDGRLERVKNSDIKVSELVCAGEDDLLVLERVSQSSRIYRVSPSPADALADE